MAELLAEFKETARFAGLYEPAKEVDKSDGGNHNGDTENPSPEIKIGDRIQWTNQGTDRFPKGAVVLGFSEDGQWVFTDQGSSGVPIGEVTIMEASPGHTPPQMQAHLAAALGAKQEHGPEMEMKPGSRKAVFPVEDGDVTLIFPEAITAEGLEELGQYLNIFLKKEQKK